MILCFGATGPDKTGQQDSERTTLLPKMLWVEKDRDAKITKKKQSERLASCDVKSSLVGSPGKVNGGTRGPAGS